MVATFARWAAIVGVRRRVWPSAIHTVSMCKYCRRYPSCLVIGRSLHTRWTYRDSLNDHIAELVRSYPQRFVGLGTIPLQAPEMAIDEMRRCVFELGLRGRTNWHACQCLGNECAGTVSCVSSCCGVGCQYFYSSVGHGGPRADEKILVALVGGNASESSLAACHLIFSGVLERLPQLRIALAHGGGAFTASFVESPMRMTSAQISWPSIIPIHQEDICGNCISIPWYTIRSC